MDHWWNFKSDESRMAWIRSTIHRIRQFHELQIDHCEISKYSHLGEIGYLNSELSKLTAEGLKYQYGGMVTSWIKDGCKKINNIERTILKLMKENSQVIEETWPDFNYQLDGLLKIYFQWENLTVLLNKAKKNADSGHLKQMFNPDLKQQVSSKLIKLFDLKIDSEKAWNKGDFAAICYFIFSSKSVLKKSYVIEKDFERFKEAMSFHFNRPIPSAQKNKAQGYWDEMTPTKKREIENIFN
jgi:hypothetical protein